MRVTLRVENTVGFLLTFADEKLIIIRLGKQREPE